jgi:hypothetical protein
MKGCKGPVGCATQRGRMSRGRGSQAKGGSVESTVRRMRVTDAAGPIGGRAEGGWGKGP